MIEVKKNKEYYHYIKKYGKRASIYDLFTFHIRGIRGKVVDIVELEEGSTVLDVCTGTGAQALAFSKRGYSVIGIDLSEDMLRVASEKEGGANVTFNISDAANMPFKNDSFDICCISFALHHMPIEVGRRVLKEIVRVAKEDGCIIIVDYALPKKTPMNKVKRWLFLQLAALFESRYFKGFIQLDFEDLVEKSKLKIEMQIPVMLGFARISKCRIKSEGRS